MRNELVRGACQRKAGPASILPVSLDQVLAVEIRAWEGARPLPDPIRNLAPTRRASERGRAARHVGIGWVVVLPTFQHTLKT